MTLEEFLNQTNPEGYDFKDLMIGYYEYYKEKHKDDERYQKVIEHAESTKNAQDDMRKWLLYKTDPYSGVAFDCDNSNLTCSLTEEIYHTLWGWEKDKSGTEKFRSAVWFPDSNAKFGGDTVNTLATTILKYTKKRSVKLLAELSTDKLSEEAGIWEDWERFAKLTSTIGNFTLVPAGFNWYRNSKTEDYWDLSLRLLKDAILPADIIWNKKYFKQYINAFFLWDYMKGDQPTPLFKSHKPLLNGDEWGHNYRIMFPQSTDDYAEFLKSVNSRIQRRGAFMVAMLRIATKYKDDYKKIMEYLCKPETMISNCENACEQLSGMLELSDAAKKLISETKKKIEISQKQ